MVKVNDIFQKLNELAPVSMKMDFDNVGLLVGEAGREVRRVIVSLDITDDVIDEAASIGAELIVSHHPLFFSLKSVTDADGAGGKIIKLIKNGIAAICMHTNLDAAAGGVNDALAARAGIKSPELLTVDGYDESGEPYCIGRYGDLREEMSLDAYLEYIKNSLGCGGLRYVSAGKKARRVAVMGGSGGDCIHLAAEKGCDTYVTADVKYHQFIEAKEAGINIIDAGHFCTENVVVPMLADFLGTNFPSLKTVISTVHAQTEKFF